MARLDRAAVLAGAWQFIEGHGVDALTMRKLASSLGVNHGTLYWHVENKQALTDALADDLLAGVADDTDSGASGPDRLLELAHRLRSALLSHRDGARVLAGTFVRQPNTLAFGEAAIGAALESGVPEPEAVLAAFSVQYYVMGFVIEEQAGYDLVRADSTRVQRETTIDFERFPNIAAGLKTLRDTPRDNQFAYGLTRLLTGTCRS
ncbi:TetR/AcrR family transcriptional regulator C-terminal domain-containing protein [Mycolicibacterium komossense]|uniref:TetR/AcrR family transcriptional regulator C-terminal domain-containing protein n=1 Tax=Mycolicibacterium komossense TaxID=1779 RepID=A0ABT3CGT0_9MYCO|nr:TetR/AcrR family transcriptional regulator C-terminal domain-containing protein [Mycolicibacterium komossense]MCV7228668.1 TetR/AcrR family transcriptional regulator C-terminal domain-containing protein [Mycolicibacterium komossense]